MTLPNFALALAYWLHILATVIWIGGLAALAILVLPAARKTLNAGDYARLFSRMQDGLQRIGWLSLAVLIGTGLFQMSAHPEYQGFLAITNSWAVAILAKHLVIGLLILTSAYLTWGVMPALKRLAFLRSAGKSVDEVQGSKLHQREELILRVNLVLSLLVLLLTAIARSA